MRRSPVIRYKYEDAPRRVSTTHSLFKYTGNGKKQPKAQKKRRNLIDPFLRFEALALPTTV